MNDFSKEELEALENLSDLDIALDNAIDDLDTIISLYDEILNDDIDDEEGGEDENINHNKAYTERPSQLAEKLFYGIGTERDPDAAVEILLNNPDKNDPLAHYIMGLANYRGEGVEQNTRRAFLHFKAAVELGYEDAIPTLSGFYWSGRETEQNRGEAIRLLKILADKDDPASMTLLAKYYTVGGDDYQDDSKAFYYMHKAAEMGYPEAEKCLADMYECGIGVDVNMSAANKWKQSAIAHGYRE